VKDFVQARLGARKSVIGRANVLTAVAAALVPGAIVLGHHVVPAGAWIGLLVPLVLLAARRGYVLTAALLLGAVADCAASVAGYPDDVRIWLLETGSCVFIALAVTQMPRFRTAPLAASATPPPVAFPHIVQALPAELPGSLSPREREVVMLAAVGMRSLDIGTRLFISQRTVESHLANAYGKLGLHSRAELIALVASLAHPQRSGAVASREAWVLAETHGAA
jgi:DNA-binding CsgD family transcriptional regulator